jgi:hypothetical protein
VVVANTPGRQALHLELLIPQKNAAD